MRCIYCNKNEATKSYERVKNGEKKREYYCLPCYGQLFLNEDGTEEKSLSACPYCGTTLKEFRLRKIVGCPYCYQTMSAGILPSIVKMQGDACGHRGKKPPLSLEDEIEFAREDFSAIADRDNYREEMEQRERFARQKREMEILVEFLETDKTRQQEYTDKLKRMERSGKIEEEIVW